MAKTRRDAGREGENAMKRLLLLLGFALLLVYQNAEAATSPACAQIPNLACASGTPTTETVNT